MLGGIRGYDNVGWARGAGEVVKLGRLGYNVLGAEVN